MSVLLDVMDFINTFGLSLSSNQIFTGVEPDNFLDPDVTIYPGASEAGTQTQDQARPALEVIRLQLICRSRKYSEAERFAYTLYDNFWSTAPYPYESIWPMGVPTLLGGPDGNARWPIGFSIRAQKSGGLSWL